MEDDDEVGPDVREMGQESRKELANYIETIESLTDEKKELAEKIKAEFADLAASGYDKKAVQQILKDRAADREKSVGLRAITASYRAALSTLAGTPLGDWARGWIAEEARIGRAAKSGQSDELRAFLKKTRTTAADSDGDDARA